MNIREGTNVDSEIYCVRKGKTGYPKRLTEHPGMPEELYVRGELPGSGPAVAIVGARMCSQYGRIQAQEFARVLAAHGVSVISGMARGADGCAHNGALEAGGRTFAVLGCGLDICYPTCNRHLFEKIPKAGGLISEFPEGAKPLRCHFPMRNRMTHRAETHWERMVARATPATPQWSTTTKNRSRTMLVRQATMRKYRGRRVSPTARRMPEPTL